ncbi:MAG: hypothetical protein AMXMBFR84_10020 [Candidatus Hydrogenedentota bacterium]
MSGDLNVSKGNTPDYINDLISYLGDREPMAVMAKTHDALDAATTNLTINQLRTPEREGKWSIIEVVQHLADTEIALAFRYRKILAEPNPDIQAYDQDLWARNLHYPDAVLDDALDQFDALRKANLRLLESQSPESLERWGMHSERGRESVADIVRLYAAHDCYHLHQIDRIKAALRQTD